MSDEVRHGTYGRLDVEDDGSRVLCHFCGRWLVQLAHHARIVHGLAPDDYRELTGLNRSTRLCAPALSERLRQSSAEHLARLHREGKVPHLGKDPEWFAQVKAKAVEAIREGFRPEGRAHQSESWTPKRRADTADLTRERRLVGEMRADPKAVSEGRKRYYAEHPEERAAAAERMRKLAAGLKGKPLREREHVCQRCGRAFVNRSTRSRWCDECRRTAMLEHGREYARERRQQRSRSASQRPQRECVCERCGRTFGGRNSRARWCEECRPTVWREYHRDWKRKHKAKGRE